MKYSVRLLLGALLALMVVSPAEAQFKFLKKKKSNPTIKLLPKRQRLTKDCSRFIVSMKTTSMRSQIHYQEERCLW